MPSKLRKAIGVVKDQTSISLAKVYSNDPTKASLEVAILKATRHDEAPIDERYINELLTRIVSGKAQAASCARIISRRIGKTRNWIVALKSLMVVLRIFQDGDPYFPREVLHTMKRGGKILNLSSFQDDSHSSPWDYTAFVRTFALYLDERLDCFLTGKLQRRFTAKNGHSRNRSGTDPVCQMKPTLLLDKITYWQKLLDRAIAMRPTGAARANKLVKICLYTVVQESFDLYRDISDGLALLLDSFFHLQYQSCASAFQCCVKATKQFEELSSFYDMCKRLSVGRTSEYPSVQKISEELMETLQEFLKDQASVPSHGRSPSYMLPPVPAAKDSSSSSEISDAGHPHQDPAGNHSERYSDRNLEINPRRTSLEDLMNVTDIRSSNCTSMDRYFERFDKQTSTDQDIISTADSSSSPSPSQSLPVSTSNSMLDLFSLEGWPAEGLKDAQQHQNNFELDSAIGWEIVLAENASNQPMQPSTNSAIGWEIVLAENARNLPMQTSPDRMAESFFDFDQTSTTNIDNGFEFAIGNNIFDQASLPEHHYNPFLQETLEMPTIATTTYDQRIYPIDDMLPMAPTFQAAAPTFQAAASTFQAAAPTFQAAASTYPDWEFSCSSADDLFAPYPVTFGDIHVSSACLDQQIVLQEQQFWIQNQDRILSKNMT